MPIALELFFDEATEAAIRDIWFVLSEHGLSHSMLAKNSRPHISLVSSDSADVEAIEEAVFGAVSVTPITFASIGIFPSETNIVYLAPVVTPELLSLHARLYAIYQRYASPVELYELLGTWAPHCTLATIIPAECIGEMITICRERFPKNAATLAALGIVDVDADAIRLLKELRLLAD